MSSVAGLDEILKKLKKLPERVQKNVVTGAIRASAKPILQEAKALVSKDSGTLKKSIAVVKRRSKDKNLIHFSIAPRIKKGGYIAHFLEFGTVKMSAKPFMRPAVEKKSSETIQFAQDYMKKRIDKELAKL